MKFRRIFIKCDWKNCRIFGKIATIGVTHILARFQFVANWRMFSRDNLLSTFRLGNDIYDPLPPAPIQCWKRCWVCVHMINFFNVAHHSTSSILAHFFKKLVDWQIIQYWIVGRECETLAILHSVWENDFCRDHCVLVMINHKSAPHIYGTPLVIFARHGVVNCWKKGKKELTPSKKEHPNAFFFE